jgi:hypothetical protein
MPKPPEAQCFALRDLLVRPGPARSGDWLALFFGRTFRGFGSIRTDGVSNLLRCNDDRLCAGFRTPAGSALG